jgi:hypothetical protein
VAEDAMIASSSDIAPTIRLQELYHFANFQRHNGSLPGD